MSGALKFAPDSGYSFLALPNPFPLLHLRVYKFLFPSIAALAQSHFARSSLCLHFAPSFVPLSFPY